MEFPDGWVSERFNTKSRTQKKCHLVIRDKKVFLLGKELFIPICPVGKGSAKSSANLIIEKAKVTCSKGKLEFTFFPSPAVSLLVCQS